MISVDMDTSTSDTVLLLANGAGGGEALTEATGAEFSEALNLVACHARPHARGRRGRRDQAY